MKRAAPVALFSVTLAVFPGRALKARQRRCRQLLGLSADRGSVAARVVTETGASRECGESDRRDQRFHGEFHPRSPTFLTVCENFAC
jgi:hypothetical protein